MSLCDSDATHLACGAGREQAIQVYVRIAPVAVVDVNDASVEGDPPSVLAEHLQFEPKCVVLLPALLIILERIHVPDVGIHAMTEFVVDDPGQCEIPALFESERIDAHHDSKS